MLLKCNAKINLGLFVTERRTDGYHNLESIFLPIPWYDVIELKEADAMSFSSEGLSIDGSLANNLCLKAYQLLAGDFSLPKVRIHLNKQIPVGAGLGGGSSDAAFILKGLNKLFGLGLSIEQLENYASRLGADCAFFVRNKPAYASGIGDELEVIKFTPKGYCLLVNPAIHISTREAYASIIPKKASINLKEAIQEDTSVWRNTISNDFEAALFPKYNALRELKIALLNLGAYYVAMSGSGSTCYAFFHDEPMKKDWGNYQVKQFKW